MPADLFPQKLTAQTVLAALAERVGGQHGVSAVDLVREITHAGNAADLRALRQIVESLRRDGHRICAHPSSGYFMAATDSELQRTLDFLYARAMTSLKQISAMNRVAMPSLRGQFGLNLESK